MMAAHQGQDSSAALFAMPMSDASVSAPQSSPLPASLTLTQWSQDWLITYKANLSHRTYGIYEIILRRHISPSVGHMLLTGIKPYHLQGLINSMGAKGLTRTTKQTLLALKQIFKRAVDNDLLIKSPAEMLYYPKVSKPIKRALTDYERACFASAQLDTKCRAFISLLLYAGLRRGEALSLTWSDIDLEAKTISISKTRTIKGNKAYIKPSPKSVSGYRIIPMPSILVRDLSAHWDASRKQAPAPAPAAFRHTDFQKQPLPMSSCIPSPNDCVIPSATTNTLMTEMSFRRFWEKIKKRLNLSLGGSRNNNLLPKDITPHIFRHTYATLLYYSNIDIKTTQYLLGHSSPIITMQLYTHLDKSKVAEEIVKLDEYLQSNS